MRAIYLLLAISVTVSPSAFGQDNVIRVSPDEAAAHLLRAASAVNSPMASMGGIQGNVILHILIDSSGATSFLRLARGHPLLVQPAIDTVKKWKYQPFEVGGRPSTVVTLAVVRFGNPVNHDAEDQAEVQWQHRFWLAQEAAESALGHSDFANAALQLRSAVDLLAPSNGPLHPLERWTFLMTRGQLYNVQQKYEEAEQSYKEAFGLHYGGNDGPEAAATLSELAKISLKKKLFDVAREQMENSVSIFQKNFKRLRGDDSHARTLYGRGVADQSWMLARLALERRDSKDAAKRCRAVLDFAQYLDPPEHDEAMVTCGRQTETLK